MATESNPAAAASSLDQVPYAREYLQHCAPDEDILRSWKIPTRLVKRVDRSDVIITDDGLEAYSKRMYPHNDEEDSIFGKAHHPIPPGCAIFYYEVVFKQIVLWPMHAMKFPLELGFAAKDSPLGPRDVGLMHRRSSYIAMATIGSPMVDQCTDHRPEHRGMAATVLGVGFNFVDSTLFFTCNGEISTRYTQEDVPLDYVVYPTICLHDAGRVMTVNFGQEPFYFNIKRYAARRIAESNDLSMRTPPLPIELQLQVLEVVAADYHWASCELKNWDRDMRTLRCCALVCRRWYGECMRHLFSWITVGNTQDAQWLRDIWSPSNRRQLRKLCIDEWLPDYIAEEDRSELLSHSKWLCTLIISLLPQFARSLKEVEWEQNGVPTKCPFWTSRINTTFPAILRTCVNVTRLVLTGHNFAGFRSFAAIVGALPSLRVLKLHAVEWGPPPDHTSLPRIPCLPCLRTITHDAFEARNACAVWLLLCGTCSPRAKDAPLRLTADVAAALGQVAQGVVQTIDGPVYRQRRRTHSTIPANEPDSRDKLLQRSGFSLKTVPCEGNDTGLLAFDLSWLFVGVSLCPTWHGSAHYTFDGIAIEYSSNTSEKKLLAYLHSLLRIVDKITRELHGGQQWVLQFPSTNPRTSRHFVESFIAQMPTLLPNLHRSKLLKIEKSFTPYKAYSEAPGHDVRLRLVKGK